MRNEGLRAAKDPREVAAAQLLPTPEREEDPQPSRIGERASPLDRLSERCRSGQLIAHTFGRVKIEAEKVADVVSCHKPILTVA